VWRSADGIGCLSLALFKVPRSNLRATNKHTMPTTGAVRRSNRLAMKSREEIQSLRVPGNSGEPADHPPVSRGNRGDGGPSRGRGRSRGIAVTDMPSPRGRGDRGSRGSAADPTSIPAARGSGTELTSNLIKSTVSRSKDAPFSQSISSRQILQLSYYGLTI